MDYFYENLKAFSKVPVFEKEIEGTARGYYNREGNEIVIDKSLSQNDKAVVLIHEITHSLYDDFDYKENRDLSEVFVESVSFIVADYFGLDNSNYSFNYIIRWSKGEPKKVIELGNKIQKCSDDFIKNLENFNNSYLQLAA